MNFERFSNIRRSATVAGRQHGSRVVAQEYIPFAGWLLSWAALTAGLGLTDALWLMAANGFVQAIRSLFLTQSFDAISARLHGPPELRVRARRLAVQVDIGVLFACVALIVPAALGFRGLGLPHVAAMMLIMIIGLPARTPALLALNRRNISTAWRLGSALTMLCGAILTLLFGLHWAWGALVLALRDWGGLLAVWLARGTPSATTNAPPADLGFAEIASRTSMAARRRLVYRIGKIALSILGPLGSIIARTSRGSGLDGRVAQKLRINPVNVGLLALLSILTTFGIILVIRAPAALLVASVTARLAAAALSVLIWWRWFATADAFSDWMNDDI